MDHVQLRVDDWVQDPPEGGEGRMLSVHLLLTWPSTATAEEIKHTLETACENAHQAVKRKLDERAA